MGQKSQPHQRQHQYDYTSFPLFSSPLSSTNSNDETTPLSTTTDEEESESTLVRKEGDEYRLLMRKEVEALLFANGVKDDGDAAKRARQWIDGLYELADKRRIAEVEETSEDEAAEADDNTTVKGVYRLLLPDMYCYDLLLRAEIQSNKKNALDRAELVLREMKMGGGKKNSKGIKIQPSGKMYRRLVGAYAKSRRSDGPEKAEKVLLQAFAEEGAIGLSSEIFNIVINAWAKLNTPESAIRATKILQTMEYLRKRDLKTAEIKAQSLLSNTKDSASSTAAATPVAVSVGPTFHSFQGVISAWAKCGSDDAGENAETVLQLMHMRKKEEPLFIPPTTDMYNEVIDAWGRSGDTEAGIRSEELLRRMESGKEGAPTPNILTYTNVINCHVAATEQEGSAHAAEAVLLRMEGMISSSSSSIIANRDDKISHDNESGGMSKVQQLVMNAHARAGSADRMEAMLRRSIALSQYQNSKLEMAVSTNMVLPCLNAWAKSKIRGKAEKAHELLKEALNEWNVIPDVRLYNTVLNACAFSDKEDSRSAITCAVRILSEMPSSGGKYQRASPDAITYGTMLKCVAHLVPEEAERARGSMSSGIFQRCRDDGMINSMILDSFRRAAPLVVQEELLVGSRGEPLGQSTENNPTMIEELAVGDLPRSWTRNSKETGWAASRRKSGNNRPKVKDSEEEEDEDKDEDEEEETIVKFRSTSIYDSDHNTFLGF